MLTRAEAFNYSTLPADTAASARAAAERIRGRLNAAFIETGRDLTKQKDVLGHGNFLAWINAEFGMSERAAQHLMSVSEFVDANPNSCSVLEGMSQYALRTLAAPSTPEPVREQVLERAEAGEKVTAKEVERLKKEFEKTKAALEKTASTLEKTKSKLQDAEEAAALRLGMAERSHAQRDEAQRLTLSVEAERDRLAAKLAEANDELARLREPGVIHILPSSPATPAHDIATAMAGAEKQFRADVDAAILNLRRVWQSADDDWRAGYMTAKGVAVLGDLVG